MNKLEAAKRKAEWLLRCLDFGWKKEDLDGLSEVWDKFRDENGNDRKITESSCLPADLEQRAKEYADKEGFKAYEDDAESIASHKWIVDAYLAGAANHPQPGIVDQLRGENPYQHHHPVETINGERSDTWNECCDKLESILTPNPTT